MGNHILKKFWGKLQLPHWGKLLRKQDLKKFSTVVASNNYHYRHFAKYYGFPIRIDSDGFSFNSTSTGKTILFRSLFVLSTLRALLSIFTLVLSLTVDRWYNPVIAPFHALLVIAFVGCSACGYLLLIKHQDEFFFVLKFNQERFGSVVNFGLRHLYLYAYPPSGNLACLLLFVVFAFNPQYMYQYQWLVYWAQVEGHLDDGGLLYAGLRVFTIVLDFFTIMMCEGFGVFVILTHATFLEVWTAMMKNLKADKFNGISNAADKWALVRQLDVMLQIFNIGNSALIIVYKMELLGLSIVGLSALLLLDFNNALFVGGFLAWESVMCPICYPILYYRGPQVTILLKEIKVEMLAKCSDTGVDTNMALLKRQLRSLSTRGVWVGPLRTFERESILIFFDFVISQVIDIVLTFGQG